jgi:hypothetical protein
MVEPPPPFQLLHGVNLDGWLAAGGDPPPVSVVDGDLARLANWRFAHVRVPLDAVLLETEVGWRALDGALDACAGNGLQCVLTLRWEQAGLYADQERWTRLEQMWGELARRYAERPGIAFCLLDAPDPPDDLPAEVLAGLGAPRLSPAAARRGPVPGATAARAWSALAQRLTQRIRAVDERRPLIVETSGAGAPAAFAHLRPTRDPATVYACRFFEPAAFTLQTTPPSPVAYPGTIDGVRWDRQHLAEALAPALAFRQTYERPVYLSAFGVSAAAPRASQLTWLRSLLSLCREQGIAWAYWCYRGGPFGVICDSGPYPALPQFQNPQRLDYDLLGVLQSEA